MDTEVGTRPCPRLAAFPITSGALNSCHGPAASPRARPAAGQQSRAAAPGAASHPHPHPAARGDPQPGGVCVVPSTRSSWLDDPRLAHPAGDVQSLVPQHPVGLLMLSRPGDSPTSAPKTGSARSAPAARGDLGIIPPDLFPGGWGGLQPG